MVSGEPKTKRKWWRPSWKLWSLTWYPSLLQPTCGQAFDSFISLTFTFIQDWLLHNWVPFVRLPLYIILVCFSNQLNARHAFNMRSQAFPWAALCLYDCLDDMVNTWTRTPCLSQCMRSMATPPIWYFRICYSSFCSSKQPKMIVLLGSNPFKSPTSHPVSLRHPHPPTCDRRHLQSSRGNVWGVEEVQGIGKADPYLHHCGTTAAENCCCYSGG